VYGQTVAERDDRGEVVGYAGTITDISDRARAETALRESEVRFRHLADTAPVMIWMADTSKLCNYFNKTWLDFTGRAIDREIGDGWVTGVHADDLRRCLETYLDSFECRVEFRMEYRLQRHDGEYRWLLDRGVPRFTAEGEFLGYIGSCIDIDDRVRAERQLQNLIEGTSSTTGKDFFPALVHHLAAALDVAHAGVGELIDGRLNILAFQSRGVAVSLDPRPIVNTPTERTVRYGRFYLESGLREEFPEAAAPVDANSYLGIALQDSRGQAIGALCLFDGEPIRSDRRAEQLLRAFAARASAELEREKATRALQKMNRDLEREVEERTAASRASEERLRLVLEGANDGFWDWDVPTGRVFVSDRWKRMRGLENEDLENPLETWSNSLHQEDRERVMKAIDDHFAGKTRFFESEYRVRHRDGSYFWVLDRGRAVRDESGRAVRMSGSGTDIDALKRAEERLVNLSDRLQLALQAGAIGTWEWDLGQNLNWDDRMLEIYGLQGLDRPVTYQDWRERVHPDDLASIEDALAETLRERQNFDREFRAYRADGELRWVHSIALVQRDPRGKPLRAIGINYDITERKRAEENLARYAREVEDLYNNAPCGYHSLDPEGRYIRVNETELQWLGYCREEMIGRPIADFLTATGRQFFEENYRAFQERGWVQNLEYEMICKDGSILPVTAGATAVKDADGNYLYNRATLVDNRERSAAERVIRQQAERESLLRQITQRIRESLDLRTIFDTACREIREVLKADRVGIFRFSPESNFVDGQFVAESVVAGFPSVLSLVVRDHCFGDNYSSLYERGRFYVIDDIYRGDLASCHTNILTRFRVRANMVMPLLRAGRLWGLLCVHQCANVRHWQSFEIDLTRQLADQLAIAIQQVDLYDRLQGELRERQQAQQELTRRNQQLAISNEELARATRLKDEFLANMSHELRTPLNAILGMAEGLQEGVFGTLVPEQLRALRTIERSGSHLLELINDILDVAKIEAGQLELDLAPTAVMPLCRSSLAFIKQQALKKGVRLEVKLPPELPDLLIDERRARQVLINLLNNAVKFTPSGGCVTLEIGRPSVRAPLEPPPLQGITKVRVYRSPLEQELGLPLPEENRSGGEYVPISIIDTGIGIPPEYLDKLFQPFIQIDSSLNRQYTGTGLGLALVKRLVELHGGQVRVTSQPGSGSRFTIELPIVTASLPTRTRSNARPEPEAPEAGEPEFEIEAAAGDGKLAHPTVLLAEDNDANVMTISAYLQARGYRVLVAGNGREAVTLNRSACPDLILMDIQMPEMDGLEAIRRIHGHAGRNAPPIVALTALAMPEDRERCLNAGADAYLSKPVKLKELAIEIDRLLAARSDEG
jgi:PAS domain S-box-containing protein